MEKSLNKIDIVRNGEKIPLLKDDVMVGDIIYLKIGMQIPADGIVLEASELKIDESVMTGEPDHIHIDIYENGKSYLVCLFL